LGDVLPELDVGGTHGKAVGNLVGTAAGVVTCG